MSIVVKVIHKGTSTGPSAYPDRAYAVVHCIVSGLSDAADQLKVAASSATSTVGTTYPYPSGNEASAKTLKTADSSWLRGDTGDGQGAVALVVLNYDSAVEKLFGLISLEWKHQFGSVMNDSGSISVCYNNMSSESAARAQFASDFPTHPSLSPSPPLSQMSSSVAGVRGSLLEVTVSGRYEWPPFDLQAYITSMSTPTASNYAIVTRKRFDVISALSPSDMRKVQSGDLTGPYYAMTVTHWGPGNIPILGKYNIPGVSIKIMTRTSTAPTPPVAFGEFITVTANGTTYANAVFEGLTSTPVQVDTGVGLFVQFDNLWEYSWVRKYSEIVDDEDPYEVTPSLSNY